MKSYSVLKNYTGRLLLLFLFTPALLWGQMTDPISLPYKFSLDGKRKIASNLQYIDEALTVIGIKPNTLDKNILFTFPPLFTLDSDDGLSALFYQFSIPGRGQYITDLLCGKDEIKSGLTGMVLCGNGAQFSVTEYSQNEPLTKSEWTIPGTWFNVLTRVGYDKEKKEVWKKILAVGVKDGKLGRYLLLKDVEGGVTRGVLFLAKPKNIVETPDDWGCDVTNAFLDPAIRTSIIHFLAIFNQVDFSSAW